MLTTRPIVSSRVKHEIEGLGLSEDFRDWRYSCALQRVLFAPSSVAITECIGKKRLVMTLFLSLSAKGERRVGRDLNLQVGDDEN